jgi:hypothetical protein
MRVMIVGRPRLSGVGAQILEDHVDERSGRECVGRVSARPVWRHHPFFTNSNESTTDADITHRQHAIIETVFGDLIDGLAPLAHLPSGHFAANAAWTTCAAITHNLLRAAGTVASARHAIARGATLRRQLVAVPARLARPQRQPVIHLPANWPWADQWTTLWTTGPPAAV